MKSKIICGALLSGVTAQRAFGSLERPEGAVAEVDERTPQTNDERRYFQLTDMMNYFNPQFDERKYWTYGCNCLILGDRPMSDPGFGPPMDALDTVCKEYKDCQKCAREAHGEFCIGEFYKYKYGKSNGAVTCKDNPNNGDESACKRKLCECDAQFARNHVSKAHVFTTDYHLFWSTLPGGWEPRDNCPRGGGGPNDPQCCGTPTTASVLYNAATKKCCAGSVKKEC